MHATTNRYIVMSAPRIAIVIPCYNEEDALPLSTAKLLEILNRLVDAKLIAENSYILCANDGSKDNTWNVIRGLHEKDSRIKGISLAHNRGHQYALLSGLMTAKDMCDAAISIDADLQDDINAFDEMIAFWKINKCSREGEYEPRLLLYGLSPPSV